MRLLITGICGYVGSRLARRLIESMPGIEICGLDNLSRYGAETSVAALHALGIKLVRGDVRIQSDLDSLLDVDWVIDCAANPTVTAGLGGAGHSSRQLLEHNLLGTLNILEFCRQRSCGLILLSTSRVYSIQALLAVKLTETATRFMPDAAAIQPPGFSALGINECFSTRGPISLYGVSKLSSENLALEYSAAFSFPLWINRCGVIGGPGQFGRAEQGVLAFWVYSFLLNRSLRYIGFGGEGKQVRDFMLAEDLADLIVLQMRDPTRQIDRIVNVGGGSAGALSLYEMTELCSAYFGAAPPIVGSAETRPYDVPYYVTDITKVTEFWPWRPSLTGTALVQVMCDWAQQNRQLVEYFMVK